MSIIQEALKKAERHIKDSGQAASAPSADDSHRSETSESSGQSAAKKTQASGSDPKSVAILLVILLVIAAVTASQLFPKRNTSARPSVTDTAVRKPAAVTSKSEELPALPSVLFQQTQPQQPQLPQEKKATAPEFVLNGIMYMEGSPRAIVNDSMVEVGDTVGGARVVKIDKKNVRLEYNDAEISLDLK